MYAIVEIAGQQFKVVQDQKLFVHRLAAEEGSKVSFDKVYLLDDGKKVSIGAPAITGASVEAKVVSHLKGDKVIVFKKKRRKGYRVKNGHRQALTELVIEKIQASGSKAKKAAEPEAPKKVTKAAADKAPVTKKAAPKKAAPKTASKDFASMTVAQLKEEAKAKAEAEMAAARAEMAAKIKSEAALKRAAAIEDRAKREAEAEKKRVEAETSRAAEKKRAEEEARVKLGVAARIQLPDGSQLTARLPAGATIGDVRAFLVANADGGEGMELWNTWPRAKLDESDQGATVAEDLGLGARPSLLALVKSGGSSGGMVRGARRYTQRQQEAAGVDRVGRGGGGWFERLLEIFRKIWAFAYAFLGLNLVATSRRTDPAVPVADVPGDPRGSNPAAAAAERRSRGGGGSNVHTLGGLRTDDDAERDDSSVRYWNGNSTQFGGDPADDDAADAPMDGFYTSRNE